ncbi:MAG: endonuclease domain-containing protein [Saprospiraceae bacterium]
MRPIDFARLLRKNQTIAEEYCWNKVRNRNFYNLKFSRQYVIEHSNILNKKLFYIADFYCHANKLIVEIDGSIHKFQKEYDQLRESHLVEMGYTVLRFSNEQVINQWNEVEITILKTINKNA